MTKRSVIFVLMLSVSVLCSAQMQDPQFAELFESETSASFREHIRNLSAAVLEGRKAGSEGETEAAQYVEQALSEAGADLLSAAGGDIFGLRKEGGDTLISRNVVAVIPGYDKELKNRFIVIGARLDNMGTNVLTVDGKRIEQVFYGANGNASGLAMLIQLARRIRTNSVLFRRSIIFVAFGASLNSNAGSWYFLNRSFDKVPAIDAMINLDMLGTGERGFYAYTASNPDMNNVLSQLAGTLQPIQPQLVSMEPCASDQRSFYGKEIPSVFFTTGMYPEYNSVKDTESIIDYPNMEKELEYIYNYTLALANGAKPIFKQSDEIKRSRMREEDIKPYNECDVPPMFLGSTEPAAFLMKWVYTYLRYPQKAVEQGIQGRVLVDFVIDEKGKVCDVKVLKGVHPLLDEEAVRVIEASPNWKPARLHGEKVKSEMSVYVEFRLKKKN